MSLPRLDRSPLRSRLVNAQRLAAAAAATAGLSFCLIAVPTGAIAQNVVQYVGTLRSGFGDSNLPGNFLNFGVPRCATVNPFVQQTFNTLQVSGYAYQEPGPQPRALRFLGNSPLTLTPNNAASPGGHGGAAPRTTGTCRVTQAPFLNPRLRSRTTIADAQWPSDRGRLVEGAATPGGGPVYDGVAVYDLAGGGGFEFPGASTEVSLPFFLGISQSALDSVRAGFNRFGGAVPWRGGTNLQVGINTRTTEMGITLATFGVARYYEGIYPTDPDPVRHRCGFDLDRHRRHRHPNRHLCLPHPRPASGSKSLAHPRHPAARRHSNARRR